MVEREVQCCRWSCDVSCMTGCDDDFAQVVKDMGCGHADLTGPMLSCCMVDVKVAAGVEEADLGYDSNLPQAP